VNRSSASTEIYHGIAAQIFAFPTFTFLEKVPRRELPTPGSEAIVKLQEKLNRREELRANLENGFPSPISPSASLAFLLANLEITAVTVTGMLIGRIKKKATKQ
jgi:hypothetical protein